MRHTIKYVSLFIGLLWLKVGVTTSDIENKVKNYFKSDVFKAFQKHWRAHRNSFENAIHLALQDNYGYKGMNVYVRRSTDSLRICSGFYGSDNVIEFVLLDTTVTSLPHLIMPEVTLALASNVLRMEAGLSKMIIETRYRLFRNQSDVVQLAADQTSDKSPFSYLQVQPYGQLAIIAEDCMLVGYVLAKLSGLSVNLGHDTFRVRNCKFTVEISSYHAGEQPIIAPYFSTEQSKQLENLLSKPIREELLPKLQAALFTYINASLIFGDYLSKYREYQNDIFKASLKYLKEIVTGINNITVQENQVTVDLEPSTIFWRSKYSEGLCCGYIAVNDVTVHGLDTLYSPHTGGPYKLQSSRIAEAMRFHSLMVRGSTTFDNTSAIEKYNFIAEIHDATIDFENDIEKSESRFEFDNWRSFELSITQMEGDLKYREDLNAYIQGYLLNKLPNLLKNHLTNIYKKLQGLKLSAVQSNNTNCDKAPTNE